MSIGTLGQHTPVMIDHGHDDDDLANDKTKTHTLQRVPSPEDAAAQQAVVVVVAAGQGGHFGHVGHPWQCFGLALHPLGLILSFQSWTERAKDCESQLKLCSGKKVNNYVSSCCQ